MFSNDDYKNLEMAETIATFLFGLSLLGSIAVSIAFAIIFHWAYVFLAIGLCAFDFILALFTEVYFCHVFDTIKIREKINECKHDIEKINDRLNSTNNKE